MISGRYSQNIKGSMLHLKKKRISFASLCESFRRAGILKSHQRENSIKRKCEEIKPKQRSWETN